MCRSARHAYVMLCLKPCLTNKMRLLKTPAFATRTCMPCLATGLSITSYRKLAWCDCCDVIARRHSIDLFDAAASLAVTRELGTLSP